MFGWLKRAWSVLGETVEMVYSPERFVAELQRGVVGGATPGGDETVERVYCGIDPIIDIQRAHLDGLRTGSAQREVESAWFGSMFAPAAGPRRPVGPIGGVHRVRVRPPVKAVDRYSSYDRARAGADRTQAGLGALARETDRWMREAVESFMDGLERPHTLTDAAFPLRRRLPEQWSREELLLLSDSEREKQMEVDRVRRQVHERKRAARLAYERQKRHTNAVLATDRAKERCQSYFSSLPAGVSAVLP